MIGFLILKSPVFQNSLPVKSVNFYKFYDYVLVSFQSDVTLFLKYLQLLESLVLYVDSGDVSNNYAEKYIPVFRSLLNSVFHNSQNSELTNIESDFGNEICSRIMNFLKCMFVREALPQNKSLWKKEITMMIDSFCKNNMAHLNHCSKISIINFLTVLASCQSIRHEIAEIFPSTSFPLFIGNFKDANNIPPPDDTASQCILSLVEAEIKVFSLLFLSDEFDIGNVSDFIIFVMSLLQKYYIDQHLNNPTLDFSFLMNIISILSYSQVLENIPQIHQDLILMADILSTEIISSFQSLCDGRNMSNFILPKLALSYDRKNCCFESANLFVQNESRLFRLNYMIEVLHLLCGMYTLCWQIPNSFVPESLSTDSKRVNPYVSAVLLDKNVDLSSSLDCLVKKITATDSLGKNGHIQYFQTVDVIEKANTKRKSRASSKTLSTVLRQRIRDNFVTYDMKFVSMLASSTPVCNVSPHSISTNGSNVLSESFYNQSIFSPKITVSSMSTSSDRTTTSTSSSISSPISSTSAFQSNIFDVTFHVQDINFLTNPNTPSFLHFLSLSTEEANVKLPNIRTAADIKLLPWRLSYFLICLRYIGIWRFIVSDNRSSHSSVQVLNISNIIQNIASILFSCHSSGYISLNSSRLESSVIPDSVDIITLTCLEILVLLLQYDQTSSDQINASSNDVGYSNFGDSQSPSHEIPQSICTSLVEFCIETILKSKFSHSGVLSFWPNHSLHMLNPNSSMNCSKRCKKDNINSKSLSKVSNVDYSNLNNASTMPCMNRHAVTIVYNCVSILVALSKHASQQNVKREIIRNFVAIHQSITQLNPYQASIPLMVLLNSSVDKIVRISETSDVKVFSLVLLGLKSNNVKVQILACDLIGNIADNHRGLIYRCIGRPEIEDQLHLLLSTFEYVQAAVTNHRESISDQLSSVCVSDESYQDPKQPIDLKAYNLYLSRLYSILRACTACIRDVNLKPYWLHSPYLYHWKFYGIGVRSRPLLHASIVKLLMRKVLVNPVINKRIKVTTSAVNDISVNSDVGLILLVFSQLLVFATNLMFNCTDGILNSASTSQPDVPHNLKFENRINRVEGEKNMDHSSNLTLTVKTEIINNVIPLLSRPLRIINLREQQHLCLVSSILSTCKEGLQVKNVESDKSSPDNSVSGSGSNVSYLYNIYSDRINSSEKVVNNSIPISSSSNMSNSGSEKKKDSKKRKEDKSNKEVSYSQMVKSRVKKISKFFLSSKQSISNDTSSLINSSEEASVESSVSDIIPKVNNKFNSALQCDVPCQESENSNVSPKTRRNLSNNLISLSDEALALGVIPLNSSKTHLNGSNNINISELYSTMYSNHNTGLLASTPISVQSYLPNNSALEQLTVATIDALFAFLCVVDEMFPMSTYLRSPLAPNYYHKKYKVHNKMTSNNAYLISSDDAAKLSPSSSTSACPVSLIATLCQMITRYPNNDIIQKRCINILKSFAINQIEMVSLSVYLPISLLSIMKWFGPSADIIGDADMQSAVAQIMSILANGDDTCRKNILKYTVVYDILIQIILYSDSIDAIFFSCLCTSNLASDEITTYSLINNHGLQCDDFISLLKKFPNEKRVQVESLRVLNTLSSYSKEVLNCIIDDEVKMIILGRTSKYLIELIKQNKLYPEYTRDDILVLLDSEIVVNNDKCAIF